MKPKARPPALVVGVQSSTRRNGRRSRQGVPREPAARPAPSDDAVRSALSMLDEPSPPGGRGGPGIEVSSYEASAATRPHPGTLDDRSGENATARTPHVVPTSWEAVGVPGVVETDDDEDDLAALWLLEGGAVAAGSASAGGVPSVGASPDGRSTPMLLKGHPTEEQETRAAEPTRAGEAPGLRRRVLHAALGAVAVTVLALGIGATTSTWVAGRPLLVGSGRLAQLDALGQAAGFQAALSASARAVDANAGSLPSVEAQDAAMQSLAAEIQAWSPPPAVAGLVRPLEREVTAAQRVDGYVEDGDRSGVVPATRLRAAESSFTVAYREAEQALGRLGAR
jgi:hypothetical protein